MGLEPNTSSFTGLHANRLQQKHHVKILSPVTESNRIVFLFTREALNHFSLQGNFIADRVGLEPTR